MLRLASYDVVFQEIPGEVTLALNISGCPNRCPGCHSPHLQEDIGELLTDGLFAELLGRYADAVTCVCLMGGDADPREVERLAGVVHRAAGGRLKAAWYSGRAVFPPECSWESFDYVKLGPYVERLGGLASETTNQVLYSVAGGIATDISEKFRKK